MKNKAVTEMIQGLTLALLVVAVLATAVIAIVTSGTNYDFEEMSYTVDYGDSLWRIANDFCPKSMDKREYIDLIIERNNLSDVTLYPGQFLVVLQPFSLD